MMPPQFLALNATHRAVREPFIGSAVIDDMNCKSATLIAENGNAGHRLASGPETKLLEAIPGQICPADFDGVLEKSHGANPNARIVAPGADACPDDNTCGAIAFPDSRLQAGGNPLARSTPGIAGQYRLTAEPAIPEPAGAADLGARLRVVWAGFRSSWNWHVHPLGCGGNDLKMPITAFSPHSGLRLVNGLGGGRI
jgi:hypothetical protein